MANINLLGLDKTSGQFKKAGTTDYLVDVVTDHINLMSYAVDNTGVVNCQTEFQNAINDSVSAKRPLYVPAGTYLVTSLELDDYLVMYGDGITKTIIKSTANNSILKVTAGNAFRMHLHHFMVEGNSTGTSQHGIQLGSNSIETTAQYSGVILEDILIKNVGGYGLRLDNNGPFSSSFRMVEVDNAGLNAFDIDNAGPTNVFDNCYVHHVADGKVAYNNRRGDNLYIGCNGIDSGDNATWARIGQSTTLGDSTDSACVPTFMHCNIEAFTEYGLDHRSGSSSNIIETAVISGSGTTNPIYFEYATTRVGIWKGVFLQGDPSTYFQTSEIYCYGRLPVQMLTKTLTCYNTNTQAFYYINTFHNSDGNTKEPIINNDGSLYRKQVTASYTQKTNGTKIIDCRHSAPITITLMSAATAGDGAFIVVKDGSGAAATNNITVNSSSGNIDGSASYVMNINYQGVYFYSDGANWFTISKPVAATPSLTSTQIAYGSGSNLLTSSANIVWDETNKRLTLANGSGTGYIDVKGASNSGAVRMQGAAHPGSGGGFLLPFVGGDQSSGPGLWWTSNDYTQTSGIWINFGFNFQGAGTGHSPLKIRKGSGSSSSGSIIYTLHPDSGYIELAPYGTSSGNTSEIRFMELAANGSNYAAIKAPDSITTTYTLKPPAALASSTGLVEIDTSGNISIGSNTNLYVSTSGSGARTIDWSTPLPYATRYHVLTGNVTFTFSNGVQGKLYTLIVEQNATGGWDITWPATVLWPGGTAINMTQTANAIDAYQFVYDGSFYYYTAYIADYQ